MKKFKYLLTTILLFFVITPKVEAGYCDKDNIAKMKEEANKISITYALDKEYYDENNELKNGIFSVKVSNMKDTMYAKIYNTDIVISNADGMENVQVRGVSSGVKKIGIYYRTCETLVRTITLNIPKYNEFSERDECKNVNIEELEVCNPWYQKQTNESTFLNKVKEYNEKLQEKQKNEDNNLKNIKNKVFGFLKQYYIFIISAIVLIVIIVAFIHIRKKRYSLD